MNLSSIGWSQVGRKAAAATVRWLGPDGGWRLGRVAHAGGVLIVVEDEHREEYVTLCSGQWEFDNPKDDAGNPK